MPNIYLWLWTTRQYTGLSEALWIIAFLVVIYGILWGFYTSSDFVNICGLSGYNLLHWQILESYKNLMKSLDCDFLLNIWLAGAVCPRSSWGWTMAKKCDLCAKRVNDTELVTACRACCVGGGGRPVYIVNGLLTYVSSYQNATPLSIKTAVSCNFDKAAWKAFMKGCELNPPPEAVFCRVS